MQILKSVKAQLAIYLICFAVFLSFRDKSGVFLLSVCLCGFSALAVESVFVYLKSRAWRVTSSSIITGLIIGYVVSADQPGWQFFLACVLAIISKHLIVYKKKHIFNPAAFGIFMVMLFFGTATQWKGTYAWYIILPFGIYFAQRLAKIRILAGYFLAAFILFGIQAFAQKTPLGNILNYFSYFYIFVMVIEPKTSPVKPARQLIFGAGIAVLIFMLTELKVNFDVELFSLLVLNLAVFLLANKRVLKKGEAG